MTIQKTIGVMDPNAYCLPASVEGLVKQLPALKYKKKEYKLNTRQIFCRPYDTLRAKTTLDSLINRGTHWSPHHGSFFTAMMDKLYQLNDMVSFKTIDKNVGYNQMARLGMRIPETWSIPQQDYSDFHKQESVRPQLIFNTYELFDLAEIGNSVGYPAFLKPQDGGGWVGVERVTSAEDLQEKYEKSGKRPMNLQKAVDFSEFCRAVGVGPQVMPMHYNPDAQYSHDRYMRNPAQAVEFDFLTPAQAKDIKQCCKIINAFYNWDHNSCEALIGKNDGLPYPIDYINAYPDSTLVSLHFYFPELVKAMVKWMAFVTISERKKPLAFTQDWDKYFDIAEKADKENWKHEDRMDELEKIADKHFDTKEFNKFASTTLKDFDEIALEYFTSEEFFHILEKEVEMYFKLPHEQIDKIQHYSGIHQFWCQCENQMLNSRE